MSQLPEHRPNRLSLGPLETEILQLLWDHGSMSVKDIHEKLLSDPDRELAYASVTTVLRRLVQKGWLACNSSQRAFCFTALIGRDAARALAAHSHLQAFLAVSTPEVAAAFADSLDQASVEQLDAIARRIRSVREARGEL
ncbi:BlaI/MecI/CopY family transcriptional regulator [Gloeobacter kilaueensis]|uniref:CopY family transcriptional regulator n=1 Tax=Gloeobacter kilaueensis (strain ATCC BAA-2537 / CCAP 1431/1 / ULC 316 / JS1) TaxID=1183438 RepID=U5QH21_GLOK1|nr:BlaI/MecI/CopY family transcriptional regulator [Gloeobacter kilaueensis]AGY58188.1 CopY family transcriptional regulator [Gloeobacter kilaueensis JS1]